VSRRGTSLDPATAAALDRAAALLRQARRVLVTGLSAATLEAVQAACDVAEAVGAAVDAGDIDAASPLAPVVARAGAITADFEELRDRADLVIGWFLDPDECRLGFIREFLSPPLAEGGPRKLIVVGPESGGVGLHLPLARDRAVDAARLLHAILVGHAPPSANAGAARVADICRELADAIGRAGCVGIVTARLGDPLGLSDWAVRLLVRTINHQRPAFTVPLVAHAGEPLENGAGAAAVLTWRYAAAGAIARADRLGGGFRPAECSAAKLVARGEVDALLAVGRLAPAVEEAIASRAADLAVIRIDDRPGPPPGCAGPSVHIRCGPPAGTVLRDDGRESWVGDAADADRGDALPALLTAIRDRIAAGADS